MLRFCLLMVLVINGLVSTASAASKPNILFILADDVGREVLGCYGGESYKTPRLDQLAATGKRFEHCYAMPVCHPTRIALLTGRYPRHIGSPKWGTFPEHAERQTFAHVMKSAGYATAIAGKWQICTLGKEPDHPQRLGFDESSLFGWHEGARYHEPMIYQNGKVRTDTAGKYGPDLYVDFLIDFMQRHKDGPFFAYYSMALCHDVTDDLKEPVPYGEHGRYDNYKEMAENMDRCVGRLVDALDRMGVRNETLILFTTDNGTAKRSIIRAEKGKYLRDPVVSVMNGKDISGGKGDMTDWGTRVPTIANWPGVIKPGSVDNSLIDLSDFLPTFAELGSGKLPSAVSLDGHSFAGLLTEDGSTKRTWAYAESRGNRYFVKTQNWKLYNNGRLFHTERDPNEKRQLSESDVPSADLAVLKQAMDTLKTRE